ncbi:MAG: D-isomer specific 2-hydroxyacid dehydrogenase NAD-binding protein [Modestobacter sp.]|nr:D-isomer specific 2-hydroxyacid dehydrogenase NAD-binding protein [Modestobacter sp.]
MWGMRDPGGGTGDAETGHAAGKGGLVDPHAVLAARADGRLGGVARDVLPEEPPPPDHPLPTHPRALVTPHVAWCSAAAEVELRRAAAQDVVARARTGRPDSPVVEGR